MYSRSGRFVILFGVAKCIQCCQMYSVFGIARNHCIKPEDFFLFFPFFYLAILDLQPRTLTTKSPGTKMPRLLKAHFNLFLALFFCFFHFLSLFSFFFSIFCFLSLLLRLIPNLSPVAIPCLYASAEEKVKAEIVSP